MGPRSWRGRQVRLAALCWPQAANAVTEVVSALRAAEAEPPVRLDGWDRDW